MADIVGMSSSKLSGALPAVSAANLTNIPAANLTGTLPAISGANLTGISAGITMADQWRVNSAFNSQNETLSWSTGKEMIPTLLKLVQVHVIQFWHLDISTNRYLSY